VRALWISLCVGLVACAAPRPAPTPQHRVIPVPPSKPALDPDEQAGLRGTIELPGCDAEKRATLRTEIDRITAAVRAPAARNIDVPTTLRDVQRVWASPCLGHLTRFVPAPSAMTGEELSTLWLESVGPAARAQAGAFSLRDTKTTLILPPTGTGNLTDAEKTPLAPWLCPADVASCGEAATFIERAERAWDATALRREASLGQSPYDRCAGARYEELKPPPTPLEAWVLCTMSRLAQSYRYPGLRFRAPERGWLVLRGRRGHHAFADEVRAYDLETGAAYVARSEGALALAGAAVDVAAVDRKRKPETYSGNVAAELVRELAFVLVTASAPRPTLSRTHVLTLPPDLPLALTSLQPGFVFDHVPDPMAVRASSQTSLTYTLLDGGRSVAEGTFTWPWSWHPSEDRADDILRNLESGLERGCARAKLPAIGRGVATGASTLDQSPARQVQVSKELHLALEGLGKPGCVRPQRREQAPK
jgi:hypothetical protein